MPSTHHTLQGALTSAPIRLRLRATDRYVVVMWATALSAGRLCGSISADVG
jgi:hypothetical protein